MNSLTRRRLLSLSAQLLSTGAVLTILPACDTEPEPTSAPPAPNPAPDPGADLLARLCQDLFPHADLPRSVYAEVAQRVMAGLAGAEADYRDFINMLQTESGAAGWTRLAVEQREEVLDKLEDTPFFNRLWGLVSGAMYTHPEVWSLIGYGGNAYEQGGYLTRGFDDIDWLEVTP